MNGAKTRMPMASPTHHMLHVSVPVPGRVAPVICRLTSAIVAVTIGTRSALATMPILSRIRKMDGWKSLYRFTKSAPARGPTTFPNAIPSAATKGMPTDRNTRNVAVAIAGHTRCPNKRNDASAIPEGSHRSVGKAAPVCVLKPNRAIIK